MMAAAPPPYSSRSQRQTARDAVNARRYHRHWARRPSFTGPLALIAVGVVALLIETGRLSLFAAWGWYMRWWPALLVGVGLLALGEWWFDRNSAYGYRRSHSGVVWLILLLAVAGYTNYGLHSFGFANGDSLFRFMGPEHDNDLSLSQPIPAQSTVSLQVPHGDVTVTLSSDAELHVQAHQVVFTASDRGAQNAFEATKPQISVQGDNVSVRVPDRNNGRTDLTVALPAGVSASITAGKGDVSVSGLKSAVDVTARQGDVSLEDVASSVHARMNGGDFTAHAIQGDVRVEGRMEDVTLSNVEGKVQLDGDFFGDTHLSQVAGTVHLRSSRTGIDLGSLPGDVTLDSGDLVVTDAAGPARVTTRAKDIACTGISGDLHVENSDGAVTVAPGVPLGNLYVSNRNGSISLTVPEKASYQIDATAHDGDISSDLGQPVEQAGRESRLTGQVGSGGPRLQIVSQHGDISISKGVLPPAPPPAPPPPPEAPGAPGTRHKGLRQFRAPAGVNPQTVVQ